MQNCFRQYPEIYGAELDTDDEDDVTADQDQLHIAADSDSSKLNLQPGPSDPSHETEKVDPAEPKESRGPPSDDRAARVQRAQEATEQVREDHGDAEKKYVGMAKDDGKSKQESPNPESETGRAKPLEQLTSDHSPHSESDSLVPKAAHDETAANKKALQEIREENK
jgi:mitochondrial intermembrane space import and assembly protein 40